jgi:RNA polymerase sigma factor (sigma-70 family)
LLTLASILQKVRSFRGRDEVTGVSDAELLRRFQTRGDEAAFELLVWRHGPMVLGVCTRVLRDLHAAEDAFQATFLTLARKAGSIGVRDAIAGWLYTVAHRIALAARARQGRQAMHERPAGLADADEPSYLPADGAAEREEQKLLRAEIDRLPNAFRSVIVLCCLQGLTRAEAAEQLGVPMGTVESRLVRARERLRRSLTARGLVLAAAPFALFLSGQASELIKVSPALVYGTVHLAMLLKIGALAAAGTAAELMEDAGRMSSATLHLTQATALLAVVTLGSGAALILPSPPADGSPAARSGAPQHQCGGSPEVVCTSTFMSQHSCHP